MGKGRPRAVEKGVLGHNSALPGAMNIPQGPVFYPTEEEFVDPLKFIYKIRPEAEPYGICRIVPPKSWKPPFALDLDNFTFPTKTQAIHQLQERSASCDPDTFELEYNRFMETHCGRKVKKRVVFEGGDLDLCKLFNAVKRYGGYDKVVKDKKWGEVFRFVRSAGKISECSKHVLCQLYREHLYDYEEYNSQLTSEKPVRKGKRGVPKDRDGVKELFASSSKRRKKNVNGDKVDVDKSKKKEEFDQICEQCKSGLHGEVMLLCDRCDKGWHIYCLSPPLEKVPQGNWYCLECVNSDKDSFGFVPGKRYTLETFRRMADRAKKKWFGSACASRLQIEKKFWDIVDGLVGEVEVMYGSDLDTSLYGSGFPRVNDSRPSSVEPEVWEKYSSSPWNLNNLPKLQGSMLQAVHNNIAGVMVPWLYIGMLFSSFCWHFEDHCFYSMNYLHWGEPKCWYSVPGSEAQAFEKVMRRSLPDLFDVQPDLLFQLVTMLNPSVLQENDVPVYTVLQEPGNFIITFPRSFHGGFNLGLNCAEAVNFAPADWLPHGGVGAELYRLYRKAAVISHEELLCVVAKTECGGDASRFLKKELIRIFTKEKTLREQLWKNGIIKSSPMAHRKHPEYVGTEEDPTCIICQQYLYLSAVVCSCRPSASVCLEHWEHLCECSPRKHRLRYRQTLAELNELMITVDNHSFKETPPSRTCMQQFLSSSSNAMTKKVKGGRVTFSQLAEEWLLSSCKILQNQFSNAAFVSALKEAEQFLWAGAEMDPVRDMMRKLVEAKKWALQVQSCISKVENWLNHQNNDMEKLSFDVVQDLLSFSELPCNEASYLKLKVYAEAARMLLSDIKSALSACSRVSMEELKLLHSRATDIPIYLEDCEKLTREISSAKVWIDQVRQCVSAKTPTSVEIDVLDKLKLEMSDFHVQLPEMELLLDLLEQVESWKIRCNELLKGPIILKDLENLLQDADDFSVNIPEMNSLRQYHSEAVSWISTFRNILVEIQERDDYDNIVQELTCILKDGELLRVQVDELPLLKEELKRACCREKALKACHTQMSLDYIQQVMSEAITLQIQNEKLFLDISRVHVAATSWEGKAKQVLGDVTQMSALEELLRSSETIFVILPSLHDVNSALSMAKSWLSQSKPFLDRKVSNSLLKVDILKDLISQSKLLKVSLEEPEMLQRILKECENWENDARCLIECAESLFDAHEIGAAKYEDLTVQLGQLLARVASTTKAGQALGFDFSEISELQKSFSKLQWCSKILSFFSRTPSLEEVESLIEEVDYLSLSNDFISSLISGVRWLRKALMVLPKSGKARRSKVTDVEEILAEAQTIKVGFPTVVAQLANAIRKHKSWQEQVHLFFNSKPGECSWSGLLHLKDMGDSDVFDSVELNMVVSEISKIEKWTRSCKDVLEPFFGEVNPYSRSLLMIKCHMDKSLQIYQDLNRDTVKTLCMCGSSDSADQDVLACLKCQDRYHVSCLVSTHATINAAKEYICPFCLCMESGTISKNGCRNMISRRKRPELKMLIELRSAANDFCVRVEETYMLQKVVEQALACKAFLTEIVDFASAYVDKDLSSISQRLLIALKALSVSGAYDHEGVDKLELVLTTYSWKVRVKKLLKGSQKPLMHQIQRLLKEGLEIMIPSQDYFMHKLTHVKYVGLQWADTAKKVASDSGTLGLEKVFQLINEGESLPIHVEKELKLLRARSVLYCICRKPYDHRAMIACDSCDEWYHFDCIKLRGRPPETYICPACKPLGEELLSSSPQMNHEERSNRIGDVEPQTPSPRSTGSKRRRKPKSRIHQKMLVVTDLSNILRHSNGIGELRWRNRKPLNRTSKKRAELDSLSPFQHL